MRLGRTGPAARLHLGGLEQRDIDLPAILSHSEGPRLSRRGSSLDVLTEIIPVVEHKGTANGRKGKLVVPNVDDVVVGGVVACGQGHVVEM